MSENRTVTLSKHEVVLDRYSAEDIWEIAFGEDAWDKGFRDSEVIEVLKSYEKKAHMYDQILVLLGFEPLQDH